MKKLIVALAAMLPLAASAVDLSVGTFQIKGASNLGFSSGTDKLSAAGTTVWDRQNSAYGLSVQGLYYFMQDVGVGLRLGYSSSTLTAKDPSGVGPDSKLTDTGLFIGPAIGLDHALTPEVSVFAEAAVGYSASTEKDSTISDTLKLSGYGFQLGAGIKYFLERHFSLDLGIGYDYSSEKSSQDVFGKAERKIGSFGVNAGLSVYFGGK